MLELNFMDSLGGGADLWKEFKIKTRHDTYRPAVDNEESLGCSIETTLL